MREVPIYRRLLGLDTASGGSDCGARRPPTTSAEPPHEPPWRQSIGSSHSTRRGRTRPWAWFLLGVMVTLGIVSFVVTDNVSSALDDIFDGGAATTSRTPAALPPGTTAIVNGIPAVGRPLRIPIGGRETVIAGTAITVEGTTPTRHGGIVVLKMRREGGAWRTLRRTRAAQDGSYRVTYRIWNPGRTQVRLVFPGGSFAYKWYRVT
jgi:hypothetical protein